ncbi:methyltransferase [Flavobacteriaceae bacterium LMO-SS05]
MRKIIKKIADPIIKFGFNKFHAKPRLYKYNNISVRVLPNVFPPHFTMSTKVLLDYLNVIDLQGKTLLELGCGSGIIALYSASKGAHVTAIDINQSALEQLKLDAKKNGIQLKIIHSNLFEHIHSNNFDYIIINPPYYPKQPINIEEQAWFCGENFEYFQNLFKQLPNHLSTESKALMILSEDCELEIIKNLAEKAHLKLSRVHDTTVMGEKQYIFRINIVN